MADNERQRRPYAPRRNTQQNRPPQREFGVEKALHNFGVTDLRELLDKKHKDEDQAHLGKQHQDEKSKNLPPPDPTYNILKDPARDAPKQPPKREGERRPYQPPHERKGKQYKNPHDDNENSNRDNRSNQKVPSKGQNNREDISSRVDRSAPRPKETEAVGPKKELRFANEPKIAGDSLLKEGRRSFKGRGPKKDWSNHETEDKIVKPVNIKVEFSSVGQRNCTVDETTELPDIKHVPDKISPHNSRFPRGGARGGRGRGNFRGRGRGARGNFRGRGGFSDRGARFEKVNGKTDPNLQDGDASALKNNNDLDPNQEVSKHETSEPNSTEFCDDAEQSNESFKGTEETNEYYDDCDESNENYEYTSEYQGETAENDQDEKQENSSALHNSSPAGESGNFDATFSETITITASTFQESGVKRSVEVKMSDEKENDLKKDELPT